MAHADVTALACDAWLAPTDARRVVEEPWRTALPGELPQPPPGWHDGGRRVQMVLPVVPGAPAACLVNVGAETGRPITWYLDGVREFVVAAAEYLNGRAPLFGRARHLLALPLVGTRSGGVTHMKGEMVAALVTELQELATRHRVDIVLVLWTRAALAAGQAVRRARFASRPTEDLAMAFDLPASLVAEARRLASLAEAGRLVLFLGAGVGAGSGLPLWNAMLHQIAAETGLGGENLAAFDALDPLDRARVLEGRLAGAGMALGERVAAIFSEGRPSLTHTLLASLPVNEFATTNYDQLFERACAAIHRPVAVLPYESARAHPRWLLKLHGCISQPNDIVLTRDDYHRYSEHRAALTGIMQALLVTRHILLVGFSLTDDNFLRLVYDVRQAIGSRTADARDASGFGTALFLGPQAFLTELWEGDVRMLPMLDRVESAATRPEAARRLEMFLDLVTMFATSSAEHLLDPTFAGMLTDDERAIRDAVAHLVASVPESARGSAAWGRIARFLAGLGNDTGAP